MLGYLMFYTLQHFCFCHDFNAQTKTFSHTILHTCSQRLSFFCVSTCQIDAHEDDVNAVAFADSSSQLLFSGSDDALCKVWDRRTLREDRPQPVGQLAGHRDGITFIHSKVGERREECCWYFIKLSMKSSPNPRG